MVPPGQCGSCRQAQVVSSARGSVFLLCRRSRTDATYPRYPALPRWTCAGYDPAPVEAPATVTSMSTADTVRIRPATPGDAPSILAFIEQLADYERLRHQVQATEAAIAETLFGPRPAAEVILASLGTRDVGFALFYQTYSTFLARPGIHLEDLFVVPDARGHGVGRALLTHLAGIAHQRDCGRLEWNVLAWNAPAIGFYRRLGAFVLDEWQTYRLDRDGIRSLAAGATPSLHHD
jgi:GNAT superfamily N-acetyltransferase